MPEPLCLPSCIPPKADATAGRLFSLFAIGRRSPRHPRRSERDRCSTGDAPGRRPVRVHRSRDIRDTGTASEESLKTPGENTKKKKVPDFSRTFRVGGRNRTRTCDPIDVNHVLCQQRQFIQLFTNAEPFDYWAFGRSRGCSRRFTCQSGSVVRTSNPACLLAHLPEIGWLCWSLSVGFIAGINAPGHLKF